MSDADLLPDKTVTGMGGRKAVFSHCMRFRYRLDIPLGAQQMLFQKSSGDGRCVFMMLNPSTADHNVNDPTVSRCVDFAQKWGFADVTILNLFAFRATDPDDLLAFGLEPGVGTNNDRHIATVVKQSRRVVLGWGNTFKEEPFFRDRIRAVLATIAKNHASPAVALEINSDGHPRHPLYVKGATIPAIFAAARLIRVQALDKPDAFTMVSADYMSTPAEAVAEAMKTIKLGDGANAYLDCMGKVFRITRKTKGKKKGDIDVRSTSVVAARRKMSAPGFPGMEVSW